mmetsp:Transcript_2908/g.5042  ORF Transcript_2908/g.5042 Transcript_2908/m.5042 type:complete len:226 (-) Transcript_2908:367-1044(-)
MYWTHSLCPCLAASCSGVVPSRSDWFSPEPPCSRHCCSFDASPASAASCKAWLKRLVPVVSAPDIRCVYDRTSLSSATSASKKSSLAAALGPALFAAFAWPVAAGRLWMATEGLPSISATCFSRMCLCTNSVPRKSFLQMQQRNFASPTACVLVLQKSSMRLCLSASPPAPPFCWSNCSSTARTFASSSCSKRRRRATSSSARRFSTSARRNCSRFGMLPAGPPK